MKKEIINKKVSKNNYEQKTIEGLIILSEDVEMVNMENYGKCPFDKDWKEPSNIIVKKGTKVDYMGQETRTGFVHEVFMVNEKGKFNSVIIDKEHICTKN